MHGWVHGEALARRSSCRSKGICQKWRRSEWYMGTVVLRVKGWWRVDWYDGTFFCLCLHERNTHQWFIIQGAADEALMKHLLSSSPPMNYAEEGGVENGAVATVGACGTRVWQKTRVPQKRLRRRRLQPFWSSVISVKMQDKDCSIACGYAIEASSNSVRPWLF